MLRTLTALMLFMLINAFSYTQAATPAGVRITNQAEASYFDTRTGQVVHLVSNIASLVVAPLLAVEQNQDQVQPAAIGAPVYFPHTIVNTGNKADFYILNAENLTGDNGDLQNIKIYVDENGDGQVNPGERELSQTDLMEPGDRLQVVVVGTVPSNSNNGDQLSIKLTTTSTNDPTVKDSDTNTVDIKDGAILRISRIGDVDCQVEMKVNDRMYYEVSYTNVGNKQPDERTINVSGAPVKGILIEESISAYFNLLKDPEFFVAPTQGLRLVADALGNWQEYTAWDGSSPISKLGVLMPAAYMKAHQSGKFGYTLSVAALPERTTTINQQAFIDLNGDGRNDFQSNTSCNTLEKNDPIIKDRDGQDVEGTVFDSAGLNGVANAKIELYSLVDNSLIDTAYSDANGHFSFTTKKAGQYYIKVLAPATHTWSSTHAPTHFTTYQVSQAAYGLYGYQGTSGTAGVLNVITATTGLVLDIPVDRASANGEIAIEKQASTTAVGIGELVSYTVKIRNVSGEDLYAAYIHDTLPAGFKYVKGTAKIGSNFTQQPESTPAADGTRLDFRIGDFPADTEVVLTYLTQVTALATSSNGINTAHAQGNTISGVQIKSPVASAQVAVKQTGVLSDRAILFGRIALEKGCPVGTEEQQANGYPLAGVRLYMEDGTYVMTDINGQYSLYGLPAGVHALKVDMHTVPQGLQFNITDAAQAGDPDSRFVDLLPGDFYRADFTVACPQAEPRTITECTEPKPVAVVEDTPVQTTQQVQQCEQKPVMRTETKLVTRTLNNPVAAIHFDSGKAVITPEYVAKLNKLATMTKDKQNVRFKFVGHTDNERLKPDTKAKFGTNQGLSEARAQEVAEFILKNLAIKTQISVEGKGETQPLASNATPEGMAKNRRVELVLLYDENTETQVKDMQQACSTKTVLLDAPASGKKSKRAAAAAEKPVCTTRTVTDHNPVIAALLAASKTTAKGWNSEIDGLDPANTENLKNLARFADKNGDISNGLMEAHRQQVKNMQENFAQEQSTKNGVEEKEPAIPNPKEVVKIITGEQAKAGTWLWPLGDTSLDGRFMVIVRADVDPTLTVNGTVVPTTQLGEQIVNKKEKAQVLAWYGVDLTEGENVLKVSAKDMFGNERVLAEKTVKRPSAGVAIKIKADGTLTADRGRSTVPVNIEILDINGYPAKGTYFLTLEASDGTWAEPDIQDKVPGHQVKVTNGLRTVHLRSSAHSSEIKLRASTGTMQSETDLSQVAELRPLVAIGLVDIRAHKGYRDGYENLGLNQLDKTQEGTEVSGRAAVFMKGKVRGDMHLTLAYDSEKDKEAELLRDIDPAEYYRVYGDSSMRGFEAQSRSKLYVKLEKDRHSAMWGDYMTDNETNGADIARASRTLTGLNGIYDNGKTRLQLFAAQQDNLRGFEEIPGNGTAMHYQLQGTPIVRNSEIVEIITRDRANIGLIVKTEKLERFRDYSLDDVTGHMSFHRVIPTLDDALNPMSIRITYDRVEQGENYLVAGVRLLHRFSDELSVGASYTKDDHATAGHTIAGVHTEYKTADMQIQAGIAQMEHADGSESGQAIRIQASKKWDNNARTEITAAQADAGYTNTTSGVVADRRELKLSHQQKLGDSIEGKVELSHSESLSTGQERQTAEVSATTKLDDWRLKGGVRYIRQADENGEEAINTALVGVERNIEVMGRKGSVKAEYEREIGDADRQRASIGADLQLTDKTKAYIRYEQADQLASGTLAGAVDTRNSLVAGVKAQVLPSTELYSEYRIEGDISGEDVVAVNGAKATFDLEKNLVVTPGVEFMNYTEESGKSDSIAASVGIRDTRDEDAKKMLRLETRHSDDEKYYGVSGTYVQKLDETTTVMVQDDLRYQQYADGREDAMKNTLTLAAAHRPQGDGNYNALYAYKWDKDDANKTDTHILSTHQHYRVDEDLDVSGRLGAKKQTLQHAGGEHDSSAALADGRALWDINDRLSLDVHGGLLATNGAEETRYALGAGFAFNVLDNVRLGAGYNLLGFNDKDLDPESFNAQGGYIGLQMKADEALFGWLEGDKQQDCTPRYMAEREQQANTAAQQGMKAPEQDDCNNNNNELKAADHEQKPVE